MANRMASPEKGNSDARGNASEACQNALALPPQHQLPAMKAFVSANPSNNYNHFYLGLVLGENKLFGEAEACFRRALQSTPEIKQAKYYLARSLLDQGKPQEALPLLDQYLGDRPEMRSSEKAGVTFNRAKALYQLGRLDEASTSLTTIREYWSGIEGAFELSDAIETGQNWRKGRINPKVRNDD